MTMISTSGKAGSYLTPIGAPRHAPRRISWLAPLLALLLAACTNGTVPVPQESTDSLADGFAGSAKAVGSTASDPAAAELRTYSIDPDNLLGKRPAAVTAAMGTPDLVRNDGPAHIALFRTSSCVIEVVYYPGDSDPALRASHVSAISRVSGADMDLAPCLADRFQGDIPALLRGSPDAKSAAIPATPKGPQAEVRPTDTPQNAQPEAQSSVPNG